MVKSLFLFLIGLALFSAAGDAAGAPPLAVVGATVFPSPTEPPIPEGVVVMENGKIAAVGRKGAARIPQGATVLDGSGLVLVAGLWNSHVHFVRPEWADAAHLPAARLGGQLRDMLTRYGFTSVFATGDFDSANTNSLRRRITDGELDGPRILTAGAIIVPPGGTPQYVAPLLQQLGIEATAFEVATPEQAVAAVRSRLAAGADAIKVFTASPSVQGNVVVMPPAILAAITTEAHRQGRLVFAHPHNAAGLQAALGGGVDILAHTAPNAGRWDDAFVTTMKRADMSLIPTLTLMRVDSDPADHEAVPLAVSQLAAYFKKGGQILFGTDVGYTTESDPAEEYELMARAGMGFREILAALTTVPAERFGFGRQTGRIAKGLDADLVLLGGDPQKDIRSLSNVRYVVQGGKVVYRQDAPAPSPSN